MLAWVDITGQCGIMEGKATPSGPPRTFSVMPGRVEITEQRRIMEGKATPSGPPRTFSVMLGLVDHAANTCTKFETDRPEDHSCRTSLGPGTGRRTPG